LAINPQKTRLFAGMRKTNELFCMRIEKDATLTPATRSSLPSDPCFVGMDHHGRYIYTTYYRAGQVAVHRWNEKDDSMTEIQRISTEPMAHSIWPDSEDRHVYVPHTGPNKIYLFDLDDQSGTLKARTPPWLLHEQRLEPRHLCFHPILDCLYTVNEGSSTVSVYDRDKAGGAISCRQTVTTLPSAAADLKGNTTAEIRITPNGRFLYASNRGHDSIACFRVDGVTGSVDMEAIIPAPAKPRVFDISPDGCFLYAAGQDSGELSAFKIDQATGRLKEQSRGFIGNNPLWILAVDL